MREVSILFQLLKIIKLHSQNAENYILKDTCKKTQITSQFRDFK